MKGSVMAKVRWWNGLFWVTYGRDRHGLYSTGEYGEKFRWNGNHFVGEG